MARNLRDVVRCGQVLALPPLAPCADRTSHACQPPSAPLPSPPPQVPVRPHLPPPPLVLALCGLGRAERGRKRGQALRQVCTCVGRPADRPARKAGLDLRSAAPPAFVACPQPAVPSCSTCPPAQTCGLCSPPRRRRRSPLRCRRAGIKLHPVMSALLFQVLCEWTGRRRLFLCAIAARTQNGARPPGSPGLLRSVACNPVAA